MSVDQHVEESSEYNKMIHFPSHVLGDCLQKNYKVKRMESHLETFKSESGLQTKFRKDAVVYHHYDVNWYFTAMQLVHFESFFIYILKEGTREFLMRFLTASGYEIGVCRFDGTYMKKVGDNRDNWIVRAKLYARNFFDFDAEIQDYMYNLNLPLDLRAFVINKLHTIIHRDLYNFLKPKENFSQPARQRWHADLILN